MGIVVDLILAAVIVISAVFGWKKGIFRSVMKFGSVVLAVIGAYFLNGIVSKFLNDIFFQPKISQFIYNSFNKTFGSASLDTLFSELPDHFTKWINSYSNINNVTEWYSGSKEATVKGLSNTMAQPIADKISVVAAYILCFLVLFIIIRLICFIVSAFLKLPVLNTVNQILGMLLGIVSGVCIAWVLAVAFKSGLPELSKMYPIFEGADKNSVFLEIMCSFNPLTLLKIFR